MFNQIFTTIIEISLNRFDVCTRYIPCLNKTFKNLILNYLISMLFFFNVKLKIYSYMLNRSVGIGMTSYKSNRVGLFFRKKYVPYVIPIIAFRTILRDRIFVTERRTRVDTAVDQLQSPIT